MFAFVHFYRECIRLENFAVMNYQGFSKVSRLYSWLADPMSLPLTAFWGDYRS